MSDDKEETPFAGFDSRIPSWRHNITDSVGGLNWLIAANRESKERQEGASSFQPTPQDGLGFFLLGCAAVAFVHRDLVIAAAAGVAISAAACKVMYDTNLIKEFHWAKPKSKEAAPEGAKDDSLHLEKRGRLVFYTLSALTATASVSIAKSILGDAAHGTLASNVWAHRSEIVSGAGVIAGSYVCLRDTLQKKANWKTAAKVMLGIAVMAGGFALGHTRDSNGLGSAEVTTRAFVYNAEGKISGEVQPKEEACVTGTVLLNGKTYAQMRMKKFGGNVYAIPDHLTNAKSNDICNQIEPLKPKNTGKIEQKPRHLTAK